MKLFFLQNIIIIFKLAYELFIIINLKLDISAHNNRLKKNMRKKIN
jgi:hypothetical protein